VGATTDTGYGEINAEICSRKPAESHEIAIGSDGTFSCGGERSILQGMIDAGRHSLAVGCRGGGCGVCRIQVMSGRYSSLPMSRAKISSADERSGLALACRIFPRSDMIICASPFDREHNAAVGAR